MSLYVPVTLLFSTSRHFYNYKKIKVIIKSNQNHILFVVIHLWQIAFKFFWATLFSYWGKSLKKMFFSYRNLNVGPSSQISKEIQLWKKEIENFPTSKGKCFQKVSLKG